MSRTKNIVLGTVIVIVAAFIIGGLFCNGIIPL